RPYRPASPVVEPLQGEPYSGSHGGPRLYAGEIERFASVYPLVTARSLARLFTYTVPEGVGKGAVVEVPFGRGRSRGVVVEVDGGAPEGIEVVPIGRVVEELPPALVDLALWLAEYYGSTPARTLALVAPRVRKRRGERPAPLSREGLAGEAEPEELTDEQRAAIDRIVGAFGTGGNFLLAGATGSGKTEVYLQACAAALERGLGAIVLVPEIALTPQAAGRFAARFGEGLAILHSGLTDAERR